MLLELTLSALIISIANQESGHVNNSDPRRHTHLCNVSLVSALPCMRVIVSVSHSYPQALEIPWITKTLDLELSLAFWMFHVECCDAFKKCYAKHHCRLQDVILQETLIYARRKPEHQRIISSLALWSDYLLYNGLSIG